MNYPVVGQRIICIANGDWSKTIAKSPGINVPKRGGIYTIREVYRDPFGGQIGIRLVEVVNTDFMMHGETKYYIEIGWLPEEFRPLEEKKTDISIFETILMGVKVHENS